MKGIGVAGLLLVLGCQTTKPAPEMKIDAGQQLSIATDTPLRVAQLPRTVIDYDRSLLNDNERQVVARLIEASKLIDEIFWRQVSEENPALRARLEKQAGASPLDRAGYDYFLMNKGPWDRLKQNEPFIGTKKSLLAQRSTRKTSRKKNSSATSPLIRTRRTICRVSSRWCAATARIW